MYFLTKYLLNGTRRNYVQLWTKYLSKLFFYPSIFFYFIFYYFLNIVSRGLAVLGSKYGLEC